jgi:hypothetical protein
VNIRKELEGDPDNVISIERFSEICAAHGFTDVAEQMVLIEYLHALGVCLFFSADPLLKKVVILKREWATSAVYKVLDSKIVIDGFEHFCRSDLGEIWTEPAYLGAYDELLQLMVSFRMCYAIPGSPGEFIAPLRLSDSRPAYEWDEQNNLLIRYVYEFMPKGIITELIVAMHEFIMNKTCVWKSGVVLEKDETLAEVAEEYGRSRKQINVRIAGRHKQEWLILIAFEFRKIHSTYSDLIYSILIPCNCDVCVGDADPQFYDYEVLRRFVSDRQRNIQCHRSYAMVPVRALIDEAEEIVEPDGERKAREQKNMLIGRVETLIINESGVMPVMDNDRREKSVRSAWANGTFYLFSFAVVFGILGYFGKLLS